MKSKNSAANMYIRRIAKSVSEADGTRGVEAFVKRFRSKGEDLESLARGLGAAEIARKRLPFEGAISLDATRRLVITLNSMSPPLRQRFTLAHEIGHLMLWDLLEQGPECGGDPQLERACDAIAAELLLPTEAVLSYVQTLSGPSPENLTLFANRFEVSLQAAALRLHEDLKLWPHSIGLWQFGDKQGGGRSANGSGLPPCPRECWFVGKRRWSTKWPPFRVFFEALKSSGAVLGRESYFEGGVMRAVALEVLHLGRGRLLGVVA
jgi:hypothetical protein